MKTFLNSVHKAIKWVGHIALIPVVAGLKAMISGMQYLHDEAEKV